MGIFSGFAGAALGAVFGRSQARKQMSFQERMASTQHQREVEDLKAAGLNPILSATGGSGAAAPGGAMPSTPDFSTSAIQTERLIQELKNMKATEQKTYQERYTSRQQAAFIRTQRQLLETSLPEAEHNSAFWRSKMGPLMKKSQKARELIFGGSSALKAR